MHNDQYSMVKRENKRFSWSNSNGVFHLKCKQPCCCHAELVSASPSQKDFETFIFKLKAEGEKLKAKDKTNIWMHSDIAVERSVATKVQSGN